MTLSVAIDAALLAVPSLANDEQEAESIIQKIIYWSRTLRKARAIRFLQLSDTTEILAHANCFPSGPNIKALLELFNLNHVYSTEDIRQSVNLILQGVSSAIDVWDVEVSGLSACKANPDLEQKYSDPNLYESLMRLVGSAVCAKIPSINNCTHIVLGTDSMADKLSFRAQIDGITTAQLWQGVYCPFSVVGAIPISSSIDEMIAAIGSRGLWNMANSSALFHLAIAAKVVEILTSAGTPTKLAAVPVFSIGSAFWHSTAVTNSGPNGTHAGTVLDTCARLIAGAPKNEVAEFHVPPRFRDGAIAYRTHITKRHEALRLMFWKTSNGVIEFANVGVKAEELIVEGDAHGVVSHSF